MLYFAKNLIFKDLIHFNLLYFAFYQTLCSLNNNFLNPKLLVNTKKKIINKNPKYINI